MMLRTSRACGFEVGRFVLAVATLALAVEAAGQDVASAQRSGREEREEFLLHAPIISREKLTIGITGSQRATLDDGRLRHDAHVQTINSVKNEFSDGRNVYRFFRDSYRYNIAASKLDALLGLGMVPVSVERRVGKEKASVTWWVDDVVMMEIDRIRAGIAPPDSRDWHHQCQHARLFSELIANADYNPTNVLISRDWKMWLIDFSRAFRERWRLDLEDERPPVIDRALYESMQRLDRETVSRELKPHLSKREISALFSRRDRLVSSYATWIADKGEDAVLCALHR